MTFLLYKHPSSPKSNINSPRTHSLYPWRQSYYKEDKQRSSRAWSIKLLGLGSMRVSTRKMHIEGRFTLAFHSSWPVRSPQVTVDGRCTGSSRMVPEGCTVGKEAQHVAASCPNSFQNKILNYKLPIRTNDSHSKLNIKDVLWVILALKSQQ